MREIGTKQFERDYASSKFPEYYEWLDLEVRNVFHKGIWAGALKCMSGFNYFGERDKATNANLTNDWCSRYSIRETWNHEMMCVAIELMRFSFTQSLQKDINKVKNCNHLDKLIALMLNDIENYLSGGAPTKGHATQSITGMDVSFRRLAAMN